MPSRPQTIIQKVAPGPPMVTAMATPAMLPSPTVPETAEVRAWKWFTSPGASFWSYLPRTSLRALGRWRTWAKPKYPVNTSPATTSQPTIQGNSVSPSGMV